jgi:L-fuconolactonase
MNIIDSHVHFVDLGRSEGLVWPSVDSSNYQNFLAADLLAESDNLLTGCVLVETSPRPSDNEWMLQIAEQEPLVLGVVASLDPESQYFADRFSKLLGRDGLLGLRIRPIEQFDLRSTRLAENLELLGVHGKTIELGATSLDRLHQYADLAGAIPGTRCILDHLGHPRIDGKAADANWLDAIREFAARENTFCKVSGVMGLAEECPAPRALMYYLPILQELFNSFGPDRLMFGSNWPPARKASGYLDAFTMLQRFFTLQGDAAIQKFFATNAQNIYRLSPDHSLMITKC